MCKLRRQKIHRGKERTRRADVKSPAFKPCRQIVLTCDSMEMNQAQLLWLGTGWRGDRACSGSRAAVKGFQRLSLKGAWTSHPETRGCQKNVGTGQSLRDHPTPPCRPPGEENSHQPSSSRPGPDSESLPLNGGLSLPRSTKFIDKRGHAGVWETGAE